MKMIVCGVAEWVCRNVGGQWQQFGGTVGSSADHPEILQARPVCNRLRATRRAVSEEER